MKKRITLLAIAFLTAIAATTTVAGFDKDQRTLSKTGTTYEYIDITFAPSVGDKYNHDFSLVEKMVPEFRICDFAESENSWTQGRLEVRYASEYSVDKETAKEYGEEYFTSVISEIAEIAMDQGLVLIPDIDDHSFQSFVKSQTLDTLDKNIIEFIKFIDIYENYEYNLKMKDLVSQIRNTIFSSVNDFVTNDALNELLGMMPTTKTSTVEILPKELAGVDVQSTNGISGYNANNAVAYAAEWWNKTNNTDYGYYAEYANHPTPKNNNMWSGGTGDNHRTWQDCANFVSQCLYAGGAEYVRGIPLLEVRDDGCWFYSDFRPSHTWGGASNFYNHWSSRVGIRDAASKTKKGDPVSIDAGGDRIPDHTIIITSINEATHSTSDMKYACHTSDQYEKEGHTLRTIYETYEIVWVYDIS